MSFKEELQQMDCTLKRLVVQTYSDGQLKIHLVVCMHNLVFDTRLQVRLALSCVWPSTFATIRLAFLPRIQMPGSCAFAPSARPRSAPMAHGV